MGKTIDGMRILSQFINVAIFVYFAVTLIKINMLDLTGLMIASIGILASLVTDIISTLKD